MGAEMGRIGWLIYVGTYLALCGCSRSAPPAEEDKHAPKKFTNGQKLSARATPENGQRDVAAPNNRTPDPQSVVELVQRNEGRVVRDESEPTQPVTEVDFAMSKLVTDDVLSHLRVFSRLRVLNLSSTDITGVGLKDLGELEWLE